MVKTMVIRMGIQRACQRREGPVGMAQVHEDVRQLQRSGHVARRGHKLGLQLRHSLTHDWIWRQRRLDLHIWPGHENRRRKQQQNRQVENARDHESYSYRSAALGSRPRHDTAPRFPGPWQKAPVKFSIERLKSENSLLDKRSSSVALEMLP